jgi:GTP:adenosylcobinamide-phosphate guanylyltransferase
MHVVITAGGTSAPDLAQATGGPYKALAPVGGRRCIDIAIEAARALAPAGIAVVAPDAVAVYVHDRVELVVPASDDGIVNIRRALRAFPAAQRLLYLTCDLPFLTAAALTDFSARAGNAGIAMALADGNAFDARFPGTAGHTLHLAGEYVANGSVFLIERAALAGLERTAGRFFSARKSLLRLAVLLGPVLLAKFALRRLRIADVEERASRELGVAARAVRGCSPGICYDIDSVADWTYAQPGAAR